MTDEITWPTEWLRGVLEVCVLRLVADGPTYGYEIGNRLASAGFGSVKGGTLYPLLKRCEEAGWLDVDWRPGDGGPGRKYYTLTPSGSTELARVAHRWRDFVDMTERLLHDAAPETSAADPHTTMENTP